jgi:hypothetical protein
MVEQDESFKDITIVDNTEMLADKKRKADEDAANKKASDKARQADYKQFKRTSGKIVKSVKWHKLPDVGSFRKGADPRDIQGAMRRQRRSLFR